MVIAAGGAAGPRACKFAMSMALVTGMTSQAWQPRQCRVPRPVLATHESPATAAAADSEVTLAAAVNGMGQLGPP